MNRLSKWIIGFIIGIVILLLTAGAVYQLTPKQSAVHKNKVIDNQEIENIKVDAEIPVKLTIGDQFKVSYQSNEELQVKERFQTLNIKQKDRFQLFKKNDEAKGYLHITVPQINHLNKVVLSSEDNETEVSHLAIDYLDIDNEDGEVNLNQLKTHRLQLSNEDGDFNVNQVQTHQIELDNQDGDFTLNNLIANYVKLENEDGMISLKNDHQQNYQTVDVDNQDGDITLANMKIRHYLEKNEDGSIRQHNVSK